jgi:hypothetical protein
MVVSCFVFLRAHDCAWVFPLLMLTMLFSGGTVPLFMDAFWNGSLVRLPGSRLRQVLSFAYGRRTFELVFEPVLADMQGEWVEDLAAGRTWHARWVRMRGYLNLLQHIVAQLPISFGRAMYELWGASKL